MTYFKKFKPMQYRGQEAVNILTAVLPSRLNVDKSYVFQNHVVRDGETAESIADALYGDAEFYWVLFAVNAMVNPFTDWPMPDAVLEEYVVKKHGDVNSIHHFFDNRILRVCDDVDDAQWRRVAPKDLPYYIVPVTNLVHERVVNNARRDIVVINPRYVQQFIEAYGDAVEGKQ